PATGPTDRAACGPRRTPGRAGRARQGAAGRAAVALVRFAAARPGGGVGPGADPTRRPAGGRGRPAGRWALAGRRGARGVGGGLRRAGGHAAPVGLAARRAGPPWIVHPGLGRLVGRPAAGVPGDRGAGRGGAGWLLHPYPVLPALVVGGGRGRRRRPGGAVRVRVPGL